MVVHEIYNRKNTGKISHVHTFGIAYIITTLVHIGSI